MLKEGLFSASDEDGNAVIMLYNRMVGAVRGGHHGGGAAPARSRCCCCCCASRHTRPCARPAHTSDPAPHPSHTRAGAAAPAPREARLVQPDEVGHRDDEQGPPVRNRGHLRRGVRHARERHVDGVVTSPTRPHSSHTPSPRPHMYSCYAQYSIATMDTDDYGLCHPETGKRDGPNNTRVNCSLIDGYPYADSGSGFTWTSAKENFGVPFAPDFDMQVDGMLGSYDGSGFVRDIKPAPDQYAVAPETFDDAIAELKDYLWFDQRTRAAMISFAVYNGNYDMFMSVQFLFEITQAGLVLPQSTPRNLRHRGDPQFGAIVAHVSDAVLPASPLPPSRWLDHPEAHRGRGVEGRRQGPDDDAADVVEGRAAVHRGGDVPPRVLVPHPRARRRAARAHQVRDASRTRAPHTHTRAAPQSSHAPPISRPPSAPPQVQDVPVLLQRVGDHRGHEHRVLHLGPRDPHHAHVPADAAQLLHVRARVPGAGAGGVAVRFGTLLDSAAGVTHGPTPPPPHPAPPPTTTGTT